METQRDRDTDYCTVMEGGKKYLSATKVTR